MAESPDTTPEPRFEGEPRGTLPAPGQPEPSLPDETGPGEAAPAGGRVDAAGAVTGEVAGSSGEAPPGGLPDDDATLEGDRPWPSAPRGQQDAPGGGDPGGVP